MRRSSSDGLNQTVPPPHVLKMTQAHGEEHKLWSQGQILAPLGTDWAWIQVLLPGECGLLRLGSLPTVLQGLCLKIEVEIM